jgi:quinol monooxygenase YgiN
MIVFYRVYPWNASWKAFFSTHLINPSESLKVTLKTLRCRLGSQQEGGSMTLTIEVKSKSGKNNELYQSLQALLVTMRQEKGCLSCRVSQDMEDGEVYVLSSDWDTESSFGSYVKSVSGIALLGAINMLGQSTRIQVGSGAKWEGAEALKKIWRSSQ